MCIQVDHTGTPIDEIECFKQFHYVDRREDGSGGWVGQSEETYVSCVFVNNWLS